MKPKKLLFFAGIFCFAVIVICFYPVTYTIHGKIEALIKTSTGFGLKIDGKVYWLNNMKEGGLHCSTDIEHWVGRTCTLTYTVAFIDPNNELGTIRTDSLIIYSF